MPTGPQPRLPAQHLGGYQLLSELGRGGMGVVYRARHPRLQREVAVKVLTLKDGVDSSRRERFRLEAAAVARLQHPGVVAVRDAGTEAECAYLVFDLIEGVSLAQVLEQSGPLPVREAAQLVERVARAVAAAHQQLILHRDIKPENVLLAQGQPLLTDFGLAKFLESAEDRGPTRSGAMLGTPGYMPPEQAAGRPVDQRSDVYGLGALLYALLTGEAPFVGDSLVEVLAGLLGREPESPRRLRAEVDRDLETICLTCLQKEPERRYESATALADDLVRYLNDEALQARPPSVWERSVKWRRRNPRVAAVMLTTATLLTCVALALPVGLVQANARARADAAAAARSGAEECWEELEALAEAPLDRRIGSCLTALEAAERWHALARGESQAVLAVQRAAVALGDLARAGKRWELAEEAYSRALGADPAAAETHERRLAEVRRERREETEQWGVEVERVLTLVEQGAFEAERLDEAVFLLVRCPARESVERIAQRLDAVTDLIVEDRRRVELQHLDLAAVACEALGRLGVRDRAVTCLGRFLEVGKDYPQAVRGVRALYRLGGREAMRIVSESGLRFESGPPNLDAATVEELLTLESETSQAYRWRGNRRLGILQDPEGALADYERALALDPESVMAWMQRGVALERLGQAAAALACYERALELEPDHEWVLHSRGTLKAYGGDPAGGLADLQRLVSVFPDSELGHHSLGVLYRELGDTVRAHHHLERVLELNPNHAVALSNRAVVYADQENLQAALRDMTRVLRLDPQDFRARYHRAQFYAGSGRLKQAARDFTRALELRPDSSDLWQRRAEVLSRLGDSFGALRDYDQAIAFDPNNLLARNNRGLIRREQGDLEGALADYDHAVRLDPAFVPALANRATVRKQLGDEPGALLDLTRAKELERSAMVLNNRGKLLRELGRVEEARADLDEALQLKPNDPYSLTNRGGLRRELGDYEGAVADLEVALRADPDFVEARQELALARLALGDPKRAEAELRAALRVAPRSPGLLETLVEVRIQGGDLSGALKAGARAVELDPTDPRAWRARARANAASGRRAEAVEDFQRYLRFEPADAAEIRRRIEELGGR